MEFSGLVAGFLGIASSTYSGFRWAFKAIGWWNNRKLNKILKDNPELRRCDE